MKKISVFVFTLTAIISAAWNDAGTVRCRGLFLWNGQYASANASGCQASDSLQTGALLLSVDFKKYKSNVDWENFWRIESRAKIFEAGFSAQGDFRYILLGASFAGNGETHRSEILSEIHTDDSLFFVGTKMGGGTVDGVKAKWKSEKRNNVLDTVDIAYKGNFLRKGVFLGGKHRRHFWKIGGDFLETRRAPMENEHYALRDSSRVFLLRSEYAYASDWGTLAAKAFWANADFRFFGIRNEDGLSKRFAFLPARANVEGIDFSWVRPRFSLQAGGFLLQGELPKNRERFYETLAPNRLLDYSLLQALSFRYFKRDYRLYGDANGFLSHFKAKRNFEFFPADFHLRPGVSADFIYAQGEFDITLESVTTSMFLKRIRPTDYFGNFKAAGAIANVSLLAETPGKNFFFRADCYQIVPFFVIKNLSKTLPNGKKQNVKPGNSSESSGPSSSGESSASPSKNSTERKNEHLPIFKTGFAADISIGFRF